MLRFASELYDVTSWEVDPKKTQMEQKDEVAQPSSGESNLQGQICGFFTGKVLAGHLECNQW